MLLENGIHVLIEKPITHSVETGAELAQLAEQKGLTLQVGHIERFSGAFRTLSKLITTPLYIECYRIAPYKPRGTDVDVIHDVMIHDIDIIMGLVNSKVRSIDAVGTAVITPSADVANARILFESGCVATVTASRVSYKTERKMRLFQPNHYISCDLAEGKMNGYRLRGDPAILGPLAVEARASNKIPKRAMALLRTRVNLGRSIRLTGVSAQEFDADEPQLALFAPEAPARSTKLNEALDRIAQRFGGTAVVPADLAGRTESREDEELRRQTGASQSDAKAGARRKPPG